MAVDLDLDDFLNAKPIRSASFCSKPADDLVSKLFDGTAGRLDVPSREERDLAVRPHGLSCSRSELLSTYIFTTSSGPSRNDENLRRLRGRSWGELSRGRGRTCALIVEPGLERPFVDNVFTGGAPGRTTTRGRIDLKNGRRILGVLSLG